MIPQTNIIAWSAVAPWAEQRQIEQDLIITRAIIELFNDDFLRRELRFRGGTALNKLHFPAPMRYSEDIDLVRTMRRFPLLSYKCSRRSSRRFRERLGRGARKWRHGLESCCWKCPRVQNYDEKDGEAA